MRRADGAPYQREESAGTIHLGHDYSHGELEAVGLALSAGGRSDMPSRALAALAGEPLKNTRTISLSADFLATVSDNTGR